MESPSCPQKVLPTAWAEVLDRVQHTLEQAAADAGRREAELEAVGTPSAAPETEPGRDDERLRSPAPGREWDRVLEQAERQAAEAAEDLAAGEEALRRWLAAVRMARQNLANGVGGEV